MGSRKCIEFEKKLEGPIDPEWYETERSSLTIYLSDIMKRPIGKRMRVDF